MNFINELKKANPEIPTSAYRCLNGIKAGKYYISIQGSEGHYCEPRMTLHVDNYSSMEIALFNNNGNNWLHITRSKKIKSFSRYSELLERADSVNSRCPVFGYVSVNLIEDLFNYLNQ